MNMTTLSRLSLAALVLATAVTACQPPAPSAPAGPVLPRLADKPDFNGVWQAIGTAYWNLEDHSAAGLSQFWQLGAIAAVPAGQSVVEGSTIPYLPAALAKRDENRAGWPKTDPEAKCYMPGVPRLTYLGWPFQIIQDKQDVNLTYEWSHKKRIVPIGDTSPLPDPEGGLNLRWNGIARGRYDGNSLVVTLGNFNPYTWFDMAGNFHSDALHVVERYTPRSPDVLDYEATIEDPKVFSRPWKISMPLYRRAERNARLLEFRCVEFAEEILYGHLRKKP